MTDQETEIVSCCLHHVVKLETDTVESRGHASV